MTSLYDEAGWISKYTFGFMAPIISKANIPKPDVKDKEHKDGSDSETELEEGKENDQKLKECDLG
jgi:hypothetical protein